MKKISNKLVIRLACNEVKLKDMNIPLIYKKYKNI